MNRKVLYLPLVIFLVLVAALMWQLLRNSDGDDPTAMTRRRWLANRSPRFIWRRWRSLT